MNCIKILICAFVLVLLFANHSPTHGQVGKPQAQATPDSERVYSGKDVDKKAQVLRTPEPTYTKDARKHKIEGTVVLHCVFASTGHVTNFHVVSGLPDGLTERAIEAARKIEFEPAIKDGHPVSMWMELQYNFNLH